MFKDEAAYKLAVDNYQAQKAKAASQSGTVQYDWDAMFREYMAGDTLKDIRARHGCNYDHLCERARRKKRNADGTLQPNWHDLRKKYAGEGSIVEGEVQKSLAEDRGQKHAASYDEFVNRSRNYLTLVERILQSKLAMAADSQHTYQLQGGRVITDYSHVSKKDLKEFLDLVEELNGMYRKAYGIDRLEAELDQDKTKDLTPQQLLFAKMVEKPDPEVNEKLRMFHDLVQRLATGTKDVVGDGRVIVDEEGYITSEGEAILDQLLPGLSRSQSSTLTSLSDLASEAPEDPEQVAPAIPEHLLEQDS